MQAPLFKPIGSSGSFSADMPQVHVAHLDVSSENSVDAFMKSIPKASAATSVSPLSNWRILLQELEEIDVLLNNAGLALHMQSLWEYKLVGLAVGAFI